MKTFYEVNGKKFENKNDAFEFEKKVEKEQAERKQKLAEKTAKKEEIKDAYNHYKELAEQYFKDYNESYDDWSYPVVDTFFKDFFR